MNCLKPAFWLLWTKSKPRIEKPKERPISDIREWRVVSRQFWIGSGCLRLEKKMKGLTLEAFRNELEGNAQKRCAKQEKTIKEQAELIKMLRKDNDELRQKITMQKELLVENAIKEFCPFDEFFMTAFRNGVNFVLDIHWNRQGYIVSAHKGERKEVEFVPFIDIVECPFDLVHQTFRELMGKVVAEERSEE